MLWMLPGWQVELPALRLGKPGKTKKRNNPLQVRFEFLQAPRRAHLEQRAHEDAEVVRRGRDQVPLANVLDAGEPGAPRAAGFADVGEAPLQALAAEPLQFLSACAARPSAV